MVWVETGLAGKPWVRYIVRDLGPRARVAELCTLASFYALEVAFGWNCWELRQFKRLILVCEVCRNETEFELSFYEGGMKLV